MAVAKWYHDVVRSKLHISCAMLSDLVCDEFLQYSSLWFSGEHWSPYTWGHWSLYTYVHN